jgi:hypothetical protein
MGDGAVTEGLQALFAFLYVFSLCGNKGLFADL